MFATLTLIALVAVASAFAPTSRMSSTRSALSMYDAPGVLPPLGFFDPLGLSKGKSDTEMKRIREAELKHGRLAMVASLGFLVQEKFHPFFDGKITGPAIYHFQQANELRPYFWVIGLCAVGVIEGLNIMVGWETPKGKLFATIKEDYVNGDLGFDPLGMTPYNEEDFNTMRTKELQNGRLAMLGITGMVVQELVTGKTIF